MAVEEHINAAVNAAVEEARREAEQQRMEFEQQYEAQTMGMVPREELEAAVEEARREAEHKYDELGQQYEDVKWSDEIDAEWQKLGCDSEQSCMELLAQYVEGVYDGTSNTLTPSEGAEGVGGEAQLQAAQEQI